MTRYEGVRFSDGSVAVRRVDDDPCERVTRTFESMHECNEDLGRREVITWLADAVPPPARRRDWRLHVDLHGIQTCGECGRSIMPTTDFYRDQVSGHLNRHVECHERAESKR